MFGTLGVCPCPHCVTIKNHPVHYRGLLQAEESLLDWLTFSALSRRCVTLAAFLGAVLGFSTPIGMFLLCTLHYPYSKWDTELNYFFIHKHCVSNTLQLFLVPVQGDTKGCGLHVKLLLYVALSCDQPCFCDGSGVMEGSNQF